MTALSSRSKLLPLKMDLTKVSPLTYDRLAAHFECLGDNCELGLVQRACGAEPLGLFRFSAVGLENLIDVISNEGVHLFEHEDIRYVYVKSNDEYLIASKHYSNDFQSHTFEKGESADTSALLIKRIRILAYLKKHFFDDMRHAEKIYIRKGTESIVDVRRLHAALKRYGPNTLLWVVEADRFHPSGTVERIEDGLWRGYVSRFKRFSVNEPIDLQSWCSVLDRTYKSCRPGHALRPERRLARGRTRVADPNVVAADRTRLGSRLRPSTDRLVFQRDTGHEQIVASAELRLAVAPKTIVVVSVWIKIDRHFDGQRIEAFLLDLPLLHNRPAHLRQRGTWQKVWVTARMPRGRDTCVLAIRADARQGSVLSIGAWTVETGPVPLADLGMRSLGRVRDVGSLLLQRRAWRDTGSTPETPKPNDVLDLSSRALAAGRFVEADDILAVALAESPGDRDLLKQYAFSAHNSGRYVAAIMRWQKALERAPEDPTCHAALAANFRDFGEIGIASSLIETALVRFPDDRVILVEAARIANAQQRYGDALSLLERAIERFGPLPELLIARSSIGAFAAGLSTGPDIGDSAVAIRGSGRLLQSSRHWLRRGKWLLAKPADILRLSMAALAEGRFADADDMLARALARAPEDRALLKQYALSAHNSGRYVAAIKRWQRALAAAPDDPMCHAAVASNFREFGQLDVAANVIGAALTRFPDDGTILTEAARIATVQHRHGDALSFLKRAIELFGPLPNLLSAEAAAKADLAEI